MSLQKTVGINARIGRVWKAWTNSQGTAQWLAPRARVDFLFGGCLRVILE
jgi:uncharacterized protein YndB with AHSA1/START domain